MKKMEIKNNLNKFYTDEVKRTILFRPKYIGKNFEITLNTAKKFEEVLVDELKKIFSLSIYEIRNNFDKEPINFFKLDKAIQKKYYSFLFTCMKYLSPKFYSKKEIDARLERLRGHDIVIFNKKTKKIEYLIEAKDFGQLVYYMETGLPKYYIYKLTVVKKILEHLQGNSYIKQFLFFRDNKDLEEERKRRKINLPLVYDENHNFKPYGFKITEKETKHKKVRKTKKGKIIPSFFIIKDPKNKDNFYPQATYQFLWHLKNKIFIEDIINT